MIDVIDVPTAYSKAIVEAGRAFPNLVVLDADLPDSCLTESFKAEFPDRSFDLGVAEQSLPTFAAGLALMDKIPFYNTFAVFAVHRGFDMIRLSIAYNRANVKIIGHASGQSLGYAGPSHHTVEDIAPMRALPGMVVLSPSDAEETRQMVMWMCTYNGPVYLRLPRSKVPHIHAPDYRFELGETELIKEGHDLSVFVTGDLVVLALELHEVLKKNGIEVQVVNVPSIKPLPADGIVRYGKETRAALTLEDHNIYGGLGSAVAEIYAEHLQQPMKRVGIPDTFTESDDRAVLLDAYGISLESTVKAANDLLSIEFE
jgi:transketolase